MKRRWVHKMQRKQTTKQMIMFDTCAICRGLLKDPCIECQANYDSDELFLFISSKEVLIQEAKDLWRTLLLLRTREPFNALDINIIVQIYKLSVPEEKVNSGCALDQLYCNHVFHRCCIRKWVAKMPTCPLDNQDVPGAFLEELSSQIPASQISPYTIEVLNVYQSTKSFVSQSLMKARFDRAWTFVLRWLKRTFPTKWPESAIIDLYEANTPEDERIEIDALKNVMRYICMQGMAQKDDKLYQHIQ